MSSAIGFSVKRLSNNSNSGIGSYLLSCKFHNESNLSDTQPPINPTPHPYLRVLWIHTLLYPGSCGRRWQLWRAYPDEGFYDTCWLTGLWSTQAKVEGNVLKAAWHCGSYSSVVNDPLGEPGRTPLYVGLPSAWGSVWQWPIVFPHFSWKDSLLGTLTNINEWINHWLWRRSISLHGEHWVGLIYQVLWGKGVEESHGDGCLSP